MAQATLSGRLLQEFSPKLDSALIMAIAADVDEQDHDGGVAARSTLLALAEATGDDHYSQSSSTTLINNNDTEMDRFSENASTATTETTTATTDEEAVERAFEAWTVEESQMDDEREKDLNLPLLDSKSDVTISQQDPVSFLKNLFPKRDRIEIQVALDDVDQDVEIAIETLLTEELLIREEEEYLRASLTDEEDSSASKSGKSRKRTRKPGKQTISLTSTPRGIASQPHASNGSRAALPEKANVWIQTDSTILYLAQLLSVPSGTLSSLFYSNNNSLPLAVSKVLDQAENYHEEIPDEDVKLVNLKELFPGSPVEALRRCLYATEGDMPKTVELFKVVEDIHAREGTPLAHGLLLQSNYGKPRSTVLAVDPGVQRLAASMPSSPGLLKTRGERPPTPQECLMIANTIRSKRDDAYRSAARTWRGKHAVGNSGVAAYWADHARQLDREARQWELRAARETVEERRKQARSTQSIDLHGLTASQALTVTNESLNAWWHNPSGSASLTIVTGAGKHSAGQAPVLLPVVRKLLEREGYDWKYQGDQYNRGSITVTGLQGRRKASGW